MAFRNPLGSVAALSLAADPASLIAAATVAGVAVTVSAAVFTYKAYKAYEEKKHREEIEHVNSLHLKHLSRIYISDYNEIQGFPPIFKLTKDKDSAAAESMHLTDEQIDDIGRSLPHGTDVILSLYREAIVNAILKLKDYYFSRNERNDITSGVISYLLYMLQTKCLNFEGYDYDIAYLQSISGFITAYASIKEREQSQEFSRLNPVFGYLTTAIQILQKHKESLSLEEMVGELRDSSIHRSNQLIRCFAKIITKDKHWRLIDLAAIDELAEGVIRREYINKEIKGLVLTKHHGKQIKPSIFSDWLIMLAKYYNQTLDSDLKISKKDLVSPNIQLSLPSQERYLALRDKPKLSKEEKMEFDGIKDKIDQIASLFESAPSFISTTLDLKTKNKLPKMISVTDPVTVLQRAHVIESFLTLIHQTISLVYLTTQLLKSTKQLGALYVKNPKHFCRIFYVLETLCNRIKDNIGLCRKNMTAIHKSDMNTMQLEHQEILPDQIDKQLATTYASISNLGSKIKDYRLRVAKNLNSDEPTFQSVKMEMFEVANLLASIYNMDSPIHRVDINGHHKHKHSKSKSKLSTQDLKPLNGADDVHKIDLHDQANILGEGLASGEGNQEHVLDGAKKTNENVSVVLANSAIQVDDSRQLFVHIDQCKTDIYTKIKSLSDNNEIKILSEFADSIDELRGKALSLHDDKDKSMERSEKVKAMLVLIDELVTRSRDFVFLDPTERGKSIQKFVHDMGVLIDQPTQSELIDRHRDAVTKWFYESSGLSVFATDTRKKFNHLKVSLNAIAASYGAKI